MSARKQPIRGEYFIQEMGILARKALVLCIDDFSQVKCEKEKEIVRCDALDTLASRGCNGYLMANVYEIASPIDRIKALLGITEENALCYPTLDIAFYSYHKEACDLAMEHGFKQLKEENLFASVHTELVSSDSASSLTFLHLNSLHLDLIRTLLTDYAFDSSESDKNQIFVSVVQYERTLSECNADPVPAHPFRPRQSFHKLDGTYLEFSHALYERFLLTFYQKNRVRRDRVEHYLSSEFAQESGYGAMHIRAFIKEIAFRLGKSPKYGA